MARCFTSGGAFAALADWLRSEAAGTRLRRADAVWRTEAARLLPELLAEEPGLPAPEPITEPWQRHRFARGLAAALLGGLGAEPHREPQPPLLLLLDDIQWADDETLEWLPLLLHLAGGTPLLVVATLRQEEAAASDALAALRATLSHVGKLYERVLRPLNLEETTALAAALAAQAGDSRGTALAHAEPIGRQGADADAVLYRDTEGNPLFIVETVRAGSGTGDRRGCARSRRRRTRPAAQGAGHAALSPWPTLAGGAECR